jgi:hypothetical protein
MNDLVPISPNQIAAQSETTALTVEVQTIRAFLARAVEQDNERSVVTLTELLRKLCESDQRLRLLSGNAVLLTAIHEMVQEVGEIFQKQTREILTEELSYHGIAPEDCEAILQKLFIALDVRTGEATSASRAAQLNKDAGVK